MKKLLSVISPLIVLLPLFIINAYALNIEEQKDYVTTSDNQTDDDYTTKFLSQPLCEIGTLVESTVRGCAPDALVNVLGYWNDKGCKIFEADGEKTYCKDIDYNSSEQVEELLNTAKINFGVVRVWDTEWTPIWRYKSGVSKTLSEYKLNGAVTCYYSNQATFERIKNEIDNDRPCIVSGSAWPFSNFAGHAVCIIGYKIPNSFFGKKYLIYVDSSGINKEQAWYQSLSVNVGILCTINLQCSDTTTTTTITAASGARFKDNGNGTVTDTRTGLVWLKNANPCDLKTWTEAGTYCNSLASGKAGLTDGSTAGQWRLPTIQELEGMGTDPPMTYCLSASIFKGCAACPVPWTMPDAPFTNVETDYYWSSTSYTYDAAIDCVWVMHMGSGSLNYAGKSGSRNYVRPVREDN